MRQIFFSLILALLPCVSFAGPHGEAILPETDEYQKADAHDRKASERYMMEVPPAMYDYGDSVTVSGREYARMQKALHPDTLFDELDGMWERNTPLAHTACVIGIMLLILVALSIVIWLINFVIDGTCGLFERKKKGAPGCGSPSGRTMKVNSNGVGSAQKEEKSGSREDAVDSVFERAGYKLPFTGTSGNDYFFIRDSQRKYVAYGNFGITGDLLERIVSLLNREPGVEELSSDRLQIPGSASNHINLLSPAGEATGNSIKVNKELDSNLIDLSGEMTKEIFSRLTGSMPEAIGPVTSGPMAES